MGGFVIDQFFQSINCGIVFVYFFRQFFVVFDQSLVGVKDCFFDQFVYFYDMCLNVFEVVVKRGNDMEIFGYSFYLIWLVMQFLVCLLVGLVKIFEVLLNLIRLLRWKKVVFCDICVVCCIECVMIMIEQLVCSLLMSFLICVVVIGLSVEYGLFINRILGLVVMVCVIYRCCC